MLLERAHSEFMERVIAATLPWDPELHLAKAIFPEIDMAGQAERASDGSLIVFPDSEDDFLRIAEEIGLPLE